VANQKLTEILADLVRQNAVTSTRPNFNQVQGLSSAILSGVDVQKPYDSGVAPAKDPRGPSFVNRVLDLLSRPLYGALTPVKHQLEENRDKGVGDQALSVARLLSPVANAKDVWAGLSGKEKTTGKDLFKAAGVNDEIPKPIQAVGGFGIDLAADPLNAVPGLGFAKLGRGIKASTEALRTVEEGTGRAAQDLSSSIAERAAQQSSDLREPPPLVPEGPSQGAGVPEAQGTAQRARFTEYTPEKSASEQLIANERVADNSLNVGHVNPELSFDDLVKKELQGPLPKTKGGFLKSQEPPSAFLREIDNLHTQIAATKSPVTKNVLRKQIGKLEAGVTPADVITGVRRKPPEFPALTIKPRWVEAATAAAADYLKTNRLKDINHIGQSRLYDKILHAASKVPKDRRAFTVLQMLRVAEDQILASGRHLTDAEGISVRLSDVANMVGGPKALNSQLVDDFRKARPSQSIEDLKAYTTPEVASDVLDPVIQTGADIAADSVDLPPSQTAHLGTEISRELGKIAEQAGASTREARTAKQFVNELFNPNRDKLYSTVQQEARNLVRQSVTGNVDADSLYKISQEVYHTLEASPRLLGRQIEQHKVVEGIMTKFATWWGAKDLKPFSREYIDTARNVAAAFSETIKPLVTRTTATARHNAWAVATGKISAGTPEEQELANQFRYLAERLMGTHGITDNAEAVVLRSGTVMKELNEELPKSLQFIDHAGTDSLGRSYDYRNANWMHSWREWEVKEPPEALYQLTRALQMVTRKNAMWDDAAVRWGLPAKRAEFQHPVAGIDRLAGMYFPKQIADQLTNLQKQLNRDVFKTPNKAVELFDKVQRMWKTGVTIYAPSHHIRNLNGDVYLAALDGVVSPRPYAISAQVLRAFPTRYKSLEDVFNIMDPALKEKALRARPGNVVLTTKYGDRVTAEQLYQAAEAKGLLIRAVHIEDLLGDTAPALGTFGASFKPLGGRVYDFATRASELRDHWVRLAHFADVIQKSNRPLDIAIEQAAQRVRKFHPDGMDLTGIEQNVLRRVIPFYSWMRKATPLVIEGAVMNPRITMVFSKAMANMQTLTGIESEGPGDPFPMDQMFPDWLKEKGIGPVLQPGSGLGRDENWRGKAPGYTIINPTNPFIDQVSQLGSPQKTILSSLTPAARIPIELLTGQTSLGIPLENQEGGVPGYLAQQIPAVSIGARVSGLTRDNEPYNPEQLINYLTSAGVTGTGPYKAQGQTEIRQQLLNLAKKNRGDYR
jgi:hypothetical protein